MKLHVDHDADALYLRLDDSKVIESQEVSPGVLLDFNGQGQVVGVEILNLSTRSGKTDLGRLLFETTGAAMSLHEAEADYLKES
jgi:uncharacterized protein YuzE